MLGFAGAGGSRSSSGNSNPPPGPAQHSLPVSRNPSSPIHTNKQEFDWGTQNPYTGWELTFLHVSLGNHLLQSHTAQRGEMASPLYQAQRNRTWSYSSSHFSTNKTRSAVPQTLSQFTSCPAPHILHTQAASGRIEGRKPSCCPELRAGQGEDGRNSSISAGISLCDLLQQISLGCVVLQQHLQHVETREECESCCYLMGTITGMWLCCSKLVRPQVQEGLNLPFSVQIFIVFTTAVKAQHLLHFAIWGGRLYIFLNYCERLHRNKVK